MSAVWKAVTGKLEPWHSACIKHDWAYWVGGPKELRKQADILLMVDVALTGHPFWAFFMYVVVRLFGGAYWPLPRRWGYGRKRDA